MSTMSFNGLLIISVIAVAAPILTASVRRVKLPSVIVEIIAGIIVGPSVLGWVMIDKPVNAVALLGLVLAGLEIDLRATAPSQFGAPLGAMPARCCSGLSRVPPSTPWGGSAIRSFSPSPWPPRPSGSSSPSLPTWASWSPFSAS
jgi:hypothetical protein